jgi:hypothetical protein
MLQALTSSQIAAATAAWTAANSQAIFGTAGFRTQPCEETSFAFDCTPSHFFPIDQGNIGVNRFADGASRVYSLSPLSDDDRTPAGGAGAPPPSGSGGGGGSGDGSGDPKDEIGADIAYFALARIGDPKNLNVGFGEKGLADVLTDHGIMEWMSNEHWDAMRAKAKRLAGMDETLRRVEKAIEDRKHEQADLARSINSTFNRILSSFFEKIDFLSPFIKKIGFLSSFIKKIGFLSSFIKKIGFLSSFINRFMDKREAKRRQYEDIGDELKELQAVRRKFEAKLRQKEILDACLDRTAHTDDHDCCCILTDKGLRVLKRMREMGEPELRKINFAYFIKRFEESENTHIAP